MDIKKTLIVLLMAYAPVAFGQTGIGTTTPAVKLHVKSNGSTFRLEGTDHVFMELFPQGAATRYAYIGYPGASSTQLTFMNLFSTGNIAWGTNNVSRMFLASDGKLSIGTSTAATTLTVGAADGTVAGEITLNPSTTQYEGGQITMKKSLVGSTSDWTIDQYGTTASDARLRFFSSSESNGFVIKENGFIGMGTSAPTVRLQVSGDIIANSIAGSSDIRFKKDISPIDNPLAKVIALRGVNFNWNTSDFPQRMFSEKRTMGFIAQEVEKVVPEIVQTENTAEGYKSVQYDKVVALLVEAVKAQQKQIQQLKREVKKLKKQAR
jgi:hypothetical protein